MTRELDKLKEHFDVRAWLDDVGVAYSTGGDNVTSGSVGLKCIYCNDHKDHLGVHLKGGFYNCWLCGERGDAVRLVMDLEGVGFTQARERLGEFQAVGVENDATRKPRDYGSLLPGGTVPINGEVPGAVAAYLERRRFGVGIIKEHDLMWCGPGGELPLRLVVPVRVGGEVVTWQAADVTGRARVKYVSCPKDRGANVREVVYGIDDVAASPAVAVVEGVADRWRVGKNRSVALFGKAASEAQLAMLHRGLRADARLAVMLDADAHEAGRRLARQLSGLRRDVRLIMLGEGDPADMTEAEAEEVMEI